MVEETGYHKGRDLRERPLAAGRALKDGETGPGSPLQEWGTGLVRLRPRESLRDAVEALDPARRPVGDDGVADDVPLREKAPVVTVEGLVAVVAQHEDAARWHRQRRQLVRRPLVDIALVLQLPVHVEPAAAHLDCVAAHGDDALDERLAVALPLRQAPKGVGRVEDHDLATPGRPVPLGHLLDGELVVDVERGVHREGWDVARLDERDADGEEEGEGRHKLLEELGHLALPAPQPCPLVTHPRLRRDSALLGVSVVGAARPVALRSLGACQLRQDGRLAHLRAV
mmetsp:Transcript_11997/g.35474  ORF Transcript_11997/g.35474 Transcript_11997/m.35474 type:complete len:285 (+) Transcript_11997:89-943(+)